MRDIRFRFYDSFNDEYSFSVNFHNLEIFFKSYNAALKGENNPILEQYTGLKDKSGVEIFEGDIVCKYLRGDKQLNFEVVFKNGQFFGLSKEADKYGAFTTKLWGLSPAFSLLVIGNIHQNPDLLG